MSMRSRVRATSFTPLVRVLKALRVYEMFLKQETETRMAETDALTDSSSILKDICAKSKISEEEVLIDLVRERPALYDTSSRKNRDLNERLWKEIAEALNTPVSDVRAKWHALRSGYARVLKKERSGKPFKRWHLMDAMSFITDHQRRKKLILNNSALRHAEDSDKQSDEEITPANLFKTTRKTRECNDSSETEEATDSSQKIPKSQPPGKRFKSVPGCSHPVTGKRQSCQLQSLGRDDFSEEPLDKNELFLKSILPDMRTLSPQRLRHFKSYIINKLFELLDEQEASEARTASSHVANIESIKLILPKHSQVIKECLNRKVHQE